MRIQIHPDGELTADAPAGGAVHYREGRLRSFVGIRSSEDVRALLNVGGSVVTVAVELAMLGLQAGEEVTVYPCGEHRDALRAALRDEATVRGLQLTTRWLIESDTLRVWS